MLINVDPQTKEPMTRGLQSLRLELPADPAAHPSLRAQSKPESLANTTSQLALQAITNQSEESLGAKADVIAAEKRRAEKEHEKALEEHKKKSSFGSRLHWTLQHPGLDWIVNSTLSLFVTFNLKYTAFGKGAMKFMSYIEKPFVYAKNAIFDKAKKIEVATTEEMAKALESVQHIIDRIRATLPKQAEQPSAAAGVTKNIEQMAESNGELLLMLIAGTMVIPPMKWMDDARERFVAKANVWWDKLKGNKPNEHDIEIAHSDRSENKPWSKWIKSRAAGVVGILAVNSAIEKYNTKNPDKDVYQIGYRWGAKIFDNHPEFASKVSNFVANDKIFSPNSKIELFENLAGKPKILELFKDAAGQINEKKAMFAEQTRLVWKEFSLTFAMMGMIAAFSVFFGKKHDEEKTKKETEQKVTAPTADADTLARAPSAEPNFSQNITPRSATHEALVRAQSSFENQLESQRETRTAATLA